MSEREQFISDLIESIDSLMVKYNILPNTGFNLNQYLKSIETYPKENGINFRITDILEDLKDLDERENITTVSPTIESWDDINFEEHGVIKFLPGDYLHLGPLLLRNLENKILVPDTGLEHPYYKAETERVRLENIDIRYCKDILVHGFLFDGISGNHGGLKLKIMDSDNIYLSHCWRRNVTGGIRGYNINNCVFWRNLSTDRPKTISYDAGATTIEAADGKISRNNSIVECEYVGMTDGIGIPINTNSNRGVVDSTVIYNCDIWLNEYNDDGSACAEDGIDIKNGGELRSYIIGCRMGGFRPTDQTCGGSGSAGQGIVFHRNAKNWTLKDCIIYDSMWGVIVEKGGGKHPDDKVEGIEIDNCWIGDIKALTTEEIIKIWGPDKVREGQDLYFGVSVKNSSENLLVSNSTLQGQVSSFEDTKHGTSSLSNCSLSVNGNRSYTFNQSKFLDFGKNITIKL